MLLFFIFINLIILILMLINLMVSYKNLYIREKNSSFECGFNKISSSRLPFSIQFFIICLLFLIFDIEISLFIPVIMGYNKLWELMLIIFMMFLFLILIIGTILEWMDNSFDWMI